MEKKSQLSVILTNTPGELSKLCDVLKAAGVNILAMSIQNAKDSVKELYNMREKAGRRIALAESYRGILKDSSDFSLIRLFVDKPVEAEMALTEAGHLLDKETILVFRLVNATLKANDSVKQGEHRLHLWLCHGGKGESLLSTSGIGLTELGFFRF
jgi:hypothetical protein